MSDPQINLPFSYVSVTLSFLLNLMENQNLDKSVISDQPREIPFQESVPCKNPKRNKYAFACSLLASMTSVLLGYGKIFRFNSLYYYHDVVTYI